MKIRERSQIELFSNTDDARPPIVRAFRKGKKWVDNFAGAGGASLGLAKLHEMLGIKKRGPDIAINHSAEALALHKANHPETEHYCEDVYKVDPAEACPDGCAFAWFSPTCIYFSQAKGGPLDKDATKVRGLAWLAIVWAASAARPDVLCLENVKPFMKWGPLHRDHSNGCSDEYAAAHAKHYRNGKVTPVCKKSCHYLRPIKAREGSLFRAFVKKLRRYYKYVTWRVLKASDYGAPTSRERFFLIASDKEVAWPEPTHGPGRANSYHTAAEHIDWTLPVPSIFDGEAYTEATLRRIAVGLQKYVLEREPFIAPMQHVEPGERRGEVSLLMAPYLIHCSNGERREVTKPDGSVIAGQKPRTYDINEPLGTIMAQGQKHALVVAYLAKGYSERETGGWNGGCPIDQPLGAITARDHHSLVAAFLVKYYGTSTAQGVNEPLHTISTGGTHHALVTVTIDGESYVVVDIGMRKLVPRELYGCQGFPPDYKIDPIFNGKPLTKTAQQRGVGNSVPPVMATVVGRAAWESIAPNEPRRAA